jgi:hypothetical protein
MMSKARLRGRMSRASRQSMMLWCGICSALCVLAIFAQFDPTQRKIKQIIVADA